MAGAPPRKATMAAFPLAEVPSYTMHRGPLSHSGRSLGPPFVTNSPDIPAFLQNALKLPTKKTQQIIKLLPMINIKSHIAAIM